MIHDKYRSTRPKKSDMETEWNVVKDYPEMQDGNTSYKYFAKKEWYVKCIPLAKSLKRGNNGADATLGSAR